MPAERRRRAHHLLHLALEPRILLDAAAGATLADVAVAVDADAQAPTVEATPDGTVPSPGENDAGFVDVDLFDDVQVQLDGNAEPLQELVVHLDTSGSNQAMLIDGTQILLQDGESALTGDNGYRYRVTVSDGTTDIALDIATAAGDAGDAAVLIDDMAYRVLDDAQASGKVEVSLSDSGGERSDPSAIATRVNLDEQSGLSSSSSAAAVDSEDPQLGADPGSLGLAKLIQTDENTDYAGINGVVSLDDQVYVQCTTSEEQYDESSETWSDVESSTLYVFQRGEDGTLSLRDRLTADAQNGLDSGTSGLGLSTDGKTLFLIRDDGKVLLFNRNAEDGSLGAAGLIDSGETLINDVLVQDDTAYVVSQQGLKVFQRQNAVWSEATNQQQVGQGIGFTSLQASQDGQFLFAAAAGGTTLVSVFSVAEDGSLTQVENLPGGADEHYAKALALSPDGKTLYLVDDKTLRSLSVGEDGKLTLDDTRLELEATPRKLIVSEDGSALFVIDASGVGLYARNADGSLSLLKQIEEVALDSGESLNFAAVQNATLSADGTQLCLTGKFDIRQGLLVLDLEPQAMTFGEGGEAVAILPGGTLADAQLDALDNGRGDYQGASIVVARAGGAQAEDVFGLLASDGFSLQGDQVQRDGGVVATFEQADGSLTLTFAAGVGRADAQKILRSISYRNDSQDPAGSATLQVSLNDDGGHSDTISLDVALEAVNDMPEVSTNGQQPTFNAEGEAVELFAGTQIDPIESGQNVWQLILTLDASVGSGDIIAVKGGRIALDAETSGRQTSAGGQQYQITSVAGGKTQLVLYVNDSAQRAAEIADSLTYSNAGADLSGARTISLSVKDSGAGSDTATAASQAKVTLAAAASANTAPSVEVIDATLDYSEQSSALPIAPQASLGDSQMDVFNDGAGNYHGAELTITLGDGKRSADVLSFAEGNGLSLSDGNLMKAGKVIGSLEVADGKMTIRFSDAAGQVPTRADAQNVLRQITYENTSDAPPAQIAVRIVLSDQRGLASQPAELAIAIAASNDAPLIGIDPGLSMGDLEPLQDLDLGQYGLSTPSASTLSSNGSRVAIADDQGRIAVFQRDAETGELTHLQTLAGESGTVQLQLTADGSSLYVLRKGSNESNTISWFTTEADGKFKVDADGKPQERGSLSGLWSVDSITLSEDQANLYLISGLNNTLDIYSRDADSGALSSLASLSGYTDSYLSKPTAITTRGDRVFVISTDYSGGSSLIVYQRDEQGRLTLLDYTRQAGAASLSGLQHLAVSADGSLIQVASGSRVSAFTLDATSGTLSHRNDIEVTGSLRDIALSTDAQALFVTLQDGTLQRYVAASGEARDSASIDGADQLLATDNGVLVLGNSASVMGSGSQATPSIESGSDTPVLIAPAITLSDAELDAADDYRGASLTLSGATGDRFGLQAGNGYSLEGTEVRHAGQRVATLVQDGTVATLTFDAAMTRAEATTLLRQLTYANEASGITEAQTRQVTLQFRDDEQAPSNEQILDIRLLPANQPPLFNGGYTSFTLDQAEAGKSYRVQLPGDLFSDPEGQPLSYAISGLPDGLNFDAQTLTLSGIAPRQVASLQLTLTAQDAAGQESSRALQLEVLNSAPVADGQYRLAAASAGQAYSVSLPDSLFGDANDADLDWAPQGLPGWLSFDPQTHSLSGIAPAATGAYAITLTATDSHGASASLGLTLQVTTDPVLPLPQRDVPPAVEDLPASRLLGAAVPNARPFQPQDEALGEFAPAAPGGSATMAGLLRDSDTLATERSSLVEQLAHGERILGSDDGPSRSSPLLLPGDPLHGSIELRADDAGSVTLELPARLPDGSTPQRVTLANGLPLPSWAAFDARSGELRLDNARLRTDGVLRLTLISRDAEGREQHTPLEIRAEQAPARSVEQAPAEPAALREAIPQRLQQQTSSALLADALELLEQLSHLAGEPVALTTRHSA